MKISLFTIVLCLMHRVNCTLNHNLSKYLDNQAKIVGEKLIRHTRNQLNSYNVKFNHINDVRLIGNYSTGEIFTIFNTSYALVDQDLYQVSQNNYTVIDEFHLKEEITLLKVTEYKNLGFILCATKSRILHIFGFINASRKIFKIQNIVQNNVTDAVFFENQHKLYLLVANYFTHTTIYKFVDSHFDEIEKIQTTAVTKLYSFHNNEDEIIVILQNFQLTSLLYTFKNENVVKLQKVDTSSPQQVISYFNEEKRYVLIFEESKNTKIYLWTGSQLLLLENVALDTSTEKIGIMYNHSHPFLLTPKNNSLQIYSLIKNWFEPTNNLVFNKNITKIWDYKIISNNSSNRNQLIILGPSVENSVEVSIFSINIEINFLEETAEEDEKLSNCFLNLEKTVYKLRNNLNTAKNISEATTLRQADTQNLPIHQFEQLQRAYTEVKLAVNDSKLSAEKIIINGTITIEDSLRADKAIIKDLQFEELIGQKWQPEQWLSYSKPQEISGSVKVKFMETDNLETDEDGSLFQDLLLSDGEQVVSGSLTINNLESTQIETNSINNISMDNLYYKSNPSPIQGLKQFPSLNVKNVDTSQINEDSIVTFLTNSSMPKYSFGNNLKIDNLWVENIDGVNFDDFKNSVFRIGFTNVITGNLTFANIEAKSLNFDTLAKNRNFLTTSTDQTINSTIKISKIFTTHLNTNTINGVDFKNSVATFDGSVINGPVHIKNIKVKNDLEMRGKVDKRFLRMNKTHIIGTNESDLLQRYNKKVKVKGNLVLKNLDIGKTAKMVVFGQDFDPKMDQFWTKTTQQAIPTHFEAQNGVSTPHVFATFVNEINVDDYMLNSTEQKKTTKFYFEDVTVKGNVLLNPEEQHTPDLRRIAREAVKINGTFNIKGHKTYNILKIDKLEIKQLNNVDIIDITNKDKSSLQNLVVKGDLYFKNLSVETINNVNLNRLLETSLYIDEPQDVDVLNFKNVSVKNLEVTMLNDHPIDDFLEEINKIKTLDQIDHLHIDGNVKIKDVQSLVTINNLEVNNLLRDGATNFENNTVFGKVKFLGNVTVRDFYVTVVNDVNLQNLSRRILYKAWSQPISQPFTFTKLKTRNLATEQINDINLKNLIDVTSTKPQELFVPNGLRILAPVQIQNLVGSLSCDLKEAIKILKSPQSQFWENVTILGNVTFFDKNSVISQIFDNVMTNNGNHVITGKTTFANHICAININSTKRINNIDVLEILQDAFINDPEVEQVVTGKKTFVNLEAAQATVLQDIEVPIINTFDIFEINNNIISKNSIFEGPIKGKKIFFGGLQTDKIETHLIRGVKPENLVSLDNLSTIPRAIFESLNIRNNFNVKFINNMPFDVFFEERLLKNSTKQTITGAYFFQDVVISGNVSTSEINNIKMANVVYDSGTQSIESVKKFKNDLEVVGNIKVEFLNGLKLSEMYEQAVIKNEKANFNGSVTIFGPTLVNGNITTRYINNFPMDFMLDTSAKHSLQSEANQIYEITGKIASFVEKYLKISTRTPTEFLYLEKSSDLQISIPNTIDAQILETKNDILIHIESEEEGYFCGLPKTCKCPSQQTMQISSKHSISSFMNKAVQRIYSYYGEDIIVHLISNAISTSTICRTNMTKIMNEISTLTWHTLPRTNLSGSFFLHQSLFNGYISGVKFFTIEGKTYVVIGFYYDPVLDTHSLNCLVLKFNTDKTQLEEIQKIPTEGTRTISLIHTAQGVILVMGNEKLQDVRNITTRIFRFNRYREQFELLREVPTFECLFAVGVVLELDSLIILANERSVLHILKYHQHFDNYYFYQSFQLDYSISSMSVFYAEGFGISDAYLSVVTKNSKYFIYSFQFIEGWKLESMGELDGIKSLIPFRLNKISYFFVPSSKSSSLLTLVEHDSN